MVNLSQYNAAPRAHHKRAPERTENDYNFVICVGFLSNKDLFRRGSTTQVRQAKTDETEEIALYLDDNYLHNS